MTTTKFKLQYAVIILKDVLLEGEYNVDSCTVFEDIDYIDWFDTEDEAIFTFAEIYGHWTKFPPNMVIKRVVKI